ncbi:virulence factor SrfC family protein [Serratia entomophila]|uniref:virulence factor SrfC family protein n=1 Tax=Serratia entomophila TaxID=42906 RepID=UPI00217B2AB0|nr:virulence factor SrfC family protein [Serratia entomophila]CAI1832434.1 Putative bacterial virulence factor [Serratia entomophila]CAI1854220.1 Putative bacterial virulence factor [Serratia entomophila]
MKTIKGLSGDIVQAIDWVAATRQGCPRLEREADNLTLRLRRCYNRATLLEHAARRPAAIGLYGHNAAAKSHLLAALAPGAELLGGDAALRVRYCSMSTAPPPAYPIAVRLLDEARLLSMTIGAALMGGFRPDGDARAIAAHLQALERHRQPMAIDGMDSNAVLALWDGLRRHGGQWQQALDRLFWPQAVALAPYLSIDDRARLFAPLWGEDTALTARYRQLAHSLHALGCSERVQAPRRLLDPLAVAAPNEIKVDLLTESGARIEIPLADLAWLAAEVATALPAGLPSDVELLDIPAGSHCPDAEPLVRLQQAKRAELLISCADALHANLLLITDAAATPQDAGRVGQALGYWVTQTQGQSAQLRSRRRPGLIWAVTPFDAHRREKRRPDDAVQRGVGAPGDSWATLLAMDERDCRRMVEYLAAQAPPALKQARIVELRQELRRELSDSLLGNWLTAGDPQRAGPLLRALQARAGAHGELLEWLLPQRDRLRQLFAQHRHAAPAPAAAPAFDPEIDLFSEVSSTGAAPLGHGRSTFARRAFADWVNHLRNLPDNPQLLALLGVDKPHLEILADALINAACRLQIAEALERALANETLPEQGEDRQIGQALTVLGDFVAWLGFQRRDAALRPASRVNHGHPIFTPPPQPAVDWGNRQRLARLAPTPAKNAAFYIFDWLVGLQALLAENAAAAPALEAAARATLAEIVARICDADGA